MKIARLDVQSSKSGAKVVCLIVHSSSDEGHADYLSVPGPAHQGELYTRYMPWLSLQLVSVTRSDGDLYNEPMFLIHDYQPAPPQPQNIPNLPVDFQTPRTDPRTAQYLRLQEDAESFFHPGRDDPKQIEESQEDASPRCIAPCRCHPALDSLGNLESLLQDRDQFGIFEGNTI